MNTIQGKQTWHDRLIKESLSSLSQTSRPCYDWTKLFSGFGENKILFDVSSVCCQLCFLCNAIRGHLNLNEVLEFKLGSFSVSFSAPLTDMSVTSSVIISRSSCQSTPSRRSYFVLSAFMESVLNYVCTCVAPGRSTALQVVHYEWSCTNVAYVNTWCLWKRWKPREDSNLRLPLLVWEHAGKQTRVQPTCVDTYCRSESVPVTVLVHTNH